MNDKAETTWKKEPAIEGKHGGRPISENKMANIICRQTNNDLEAFQTAQGMENAGASVFSISHAGMRKPDGAMIPSAQYVVWAKYEPPVTTEYIDSMINRELYGDEV